MNQLFIGIGVALIVALCTAVLAPYFIDWNLLRANFETQMSLAAGMPVHIRGKTAAVLLPSPTITFTDVAIGADDNHPLLTARRFSAEIDLFPLLSGEIHVLNMLLDQPVLRIEAGAGADLALPDNGSGRQASPGKLEIDKFEIADGTATIADPRSGVTAGAGAINATLTAGSIAGPFKAEGSALVADAPTTFSLATGERDRDSGAIRVKLRLEPATHPVRIDLEGLLQKADDGALDWKPHLHIERLIRPQDAKGTLGWSIDSSITATTAHLLAPDLTFSYGPPDRPFTLTGALDLSLGRAPSFAAVLSARQIDLDRTFGPGVANPVNPGAVLPKLADLVAGLPLPPIPGSLGFAGPVIVIGGGLIENVRLDAAASPGKGWTIEALTADLPGHSQLSATGQLALVPDVVFDGETRLYSSQPMGLLDWWQPPGGARPVLHRIEAQAQLHASAAGLALDRLSTTIDGTAVRGSFSWLGAELDRPARLKLALDADRLGADDLALLWRTTASNTPLATLADTDLDLSLASGHVDTADFSASGIDIAITRARGKLTINHASIADLAGINVNASGALDHLDGAPVGRINASVKATRADGLRLLLLKLGGDAAWVDRLRSAAPAASPLDLSAELDAAPAGTIPHVTFSLDGMAGTAKLTAKLTASAGIDGTLADWRHDRLSVKASLNGPDARLIADLADLPASIGGEAGSVTLSLDGATDDDLKLSLDALAGKSRLSAEGTASPGAPVPRGKFTLDTDLPDVLEFTDSGIAAVTGRTESLPLAGKATLSFAGPLLHIDDIDGTFGGSSTVKGQLAVDLTAERPRTTGHLAFGTLPVGALAEAALGIGAFTDSAAVWPGLPFGPMPLRAGDLDLAISADRVPLAGPGVPTTAVTAAITAVRAELTASASRFALRDLTGTLGGGTLTSQISVERADDALAGMIIDLGVKGAALGELLPASVPLTGPFELTANATTHGRSVAGLVANLTGSGSLRLGNGRIAGIDASVLRSVIPDDPPPVAGGDEAGILDKDVAAALRHRLDAARAAGAMLAFTGMETALTLGNGIVRLGSITLDGAALATSGTMAIDLNHLAQQGSLTFRDAAADRLPGGEPARFTMNFSGPITAPVVTLDTSALTSLLNLAVFERENQRVEDIEADILERDRLMRMVMRRQGEIAAHQAAAPRPGP